MQIIIYKFVDGTTNAVEVTEDIYLIHLELLQKEKRYHWKETRRHTSLYYFTDMGIDYEDKRIDIFAEIVRKEDAERVHKALLTLSDKRRDLVRKFYFEEMSYRAIAEQIGVSHTAISQRMKTIRKRLQKQLRDCSI
ncbi:MAG: sigma-70 family RNA polymerase sigma factor [Clostridia bacterium]|jgi:RNA polymerase sigma factor (sigma-70 family)|nr:sigma-70 family RNA polymerase sigma factor [Clostridia bacterium]